jgi:hypothetical protein
MQRSPGAVLGGLRDHVLLCCDWTKRLRRGMGGAVLLSWSPRNWSGNTCRFDRGHAAEREDVPTPSVGTRWSGIAWRFDRGHAAEREDVPTPSVGTRYFREAPRSVANRGGLCRVLSFAAKMVVASGPLSRSTTGDEPGARQRDPSKFG